MRRHFLLIITALLALPAMGQALLFETFSGGIPSGWVLFNDQNTAHDTAYREAWVATPTLGNPAPGIASTSWFNSPADADRWIVTPPVLVDREGLCFVMEAAAIESAYADGVEVRVSTRGNASRQPFSSPLASVARCETSFCDVIVPLDDYVGDTVWIAVVQANYDDHLLLADNFRVCRPADPEMELTRLLLPDTLTDPFLPQALVTNKSLTPYSGPLCLSLSVDGGEPSLLTLQADSLAHGESLLIALEDSVSPSGVLTHLSLSLLPVGATDFEGNNCIALSLTGTGQVVDIAPAAERAGTLAVYPNPSRGAFAVEGAQGPVRILSLGGRPASQPLRPGTYILTDGHSATKLVISH